MVFGRKMVGAAAVALAAMSVSPMAQAQPPQQQQQIPDAPRPQALPQLNTVTPAGPSLPQAPAPATPPANSAAADAAAAKENGGIIPSTKLPSAEGPVVSEPDSGPTPAGPTNSSQILHVNVYYVQVPFTVKDSKGHLYPGLTWRDVRVYENGQRQNIRNFYVDPFPLSVALVIDQSVTSDTMEKINTALSALQGAFSSYDEVSVFTYNNGVTKQTGFTAAQSPRLAFFLDKSKGKGREPNMAMGGPLDQTTIKNNQQVDPNTTPIRNQQGITIYQEKEYHTLNDAILAAAQETMHAGRERRRIVYVISDGKEYGSKAKEKDVIKYLQTNNIEVYATLVGDSALPGMGFLDRIHLPYTMREDVLPRYAAATGGQCDPEFRPKGIEESFAKLTEQVRTQYTLGYYSSEPALDGKFRNIEVRVLRPSLDVIAKKGYYPAATPTQGATPRPVPTTPAPTQ